MTDFPEGKGVLSNGTVFCHSGSSSSHYEAGELWSRDI